MSYSEVMTFSTTLGHAGGLRVLALLSGCGTTRVLPPPAPDAPTAVFLLDHGDHSSLVLPAEDGAVVRYAYGDWDYYVLEQTGAGDGFAALLWPTDAALGRRRLAGPATRAAVRRQVLVTVTEVFRLEVEQARAAALRTRLDGIYAAGREQRVYSESKDLYLVPHPRPYTVANTSNAMSARWLEELGCTVRGPALGSEWRVVTPEVVD